VSAWVNQKESRTDDTRHARRASQQKRLPIRPGSFCCYEFIVRPICDIITSPHYFPISQAQGCDHQQWIAATDMLGPIFAAIMLRRPEPTKQRGEPTILRIRAIEITHLTRFTLLLLLRIQRYMWRNHVATWTDANNSGRNLDLKTRFRFRVCIICCNIIFGLDFNLKKLNHFTASAIWKRFKVTAWGPLPWSRYANTTLNHDKVSIYCALLAPQWKVKS